MVSGQDSMIHTEFSFVPGMNASFQAAMEALPESGYKVSVQGLCKVSLFFGIIIDNWQVH